MTETDHVKTKDEDKNKNKNRYCKNILLKQKAGTKPRMRTDCSNQNSSKGKHKNRLQQQKTRPRSDLALIKNKDI